MAAHRRDEQNEPKVKGALGLGQGSIHWTSASWISGWASSWAHPLLLSFLLLSLDPTPFPNLIFISFKTPLLLQKIHKNMLKI